MTLRDLPSCCFSVVRNITVGVAPVSLPSVICNPSIVSSRDEYDSAKDEKCNTCGPEAQSTLVRTCKGESQQAPSMPFQGR